MNKLSSNEMSQAKGGFDRTIKQTVKHPNGTTSTVDEDGTVHPDIEEDPD